ncbi:DHHC zinc finger domain-containing protein [Cryptosporidium andersoni]|uniref:Palmitoyltransferase n=1 Tax=Cryptosporidium andersoni TaxID=117008 RepID=A0A1J4MCK6_9CRYT|nr:DHHC zinc finger domain-containing protein [Cryptosporidium andersoni]
MELSQNKGTRLFEAEYASHELAIAAQRRDKNTLHFIIQQLIETGNASILNDSNTLHWTVYYQWDDVTIHLLSLGCDPFRADINGDTTLHYCVRSGNFSMLKYFYEKYSSRIFSVKNRNNFGLMLTAASENVENKVQDLLRIMEWLFLQGYTLEEQDILGQTPLFWAIKRGNCSLVQWLVSHGANLGHKDHRGNTILHVACVSESEDTVQFLCDLGAIHLLQCKNYDSSMVGNTAFQLCWIKRNYWLAVSLYFWYYHNKLFGTTALIRSPYAVYYWFIALFNLAIVLIMRNTISKYQEYMAGISMDHYYIWFGAFVVTQLCWFLANFGHSNYVKYPLYPKSISKLSYDKIKKLESIALYIPIISNSKVNKSSSVFQLMLKEEEQVKINNDLIELNRQIFSGESIGLDIYKNTYNGYIQKLIDISNEITSLMSLVAKERQSIHKKLYVDIVDGNQIISSAPVLPKICVTCRTERPFRAHHCSECGYCIQRFDHHCVWIDTCVGLGNQRSFVLFLMFLLFTFSWYYYLLQQYCSLRFLFATTVNKVTNTPSNINSWFSLQGNDLFASNNDLGIGVFDGLYYFMVSDLWFSVIMLNSITNIPWMGFVIYLFVRHLKSMITNVTFYEYLKKPDIIKQRYNGYDIDGFCFELQDRNLFTGIRSIFAYCIKSNAWDYSDFFSNKQHSATVPPVSSLLDSSFPYHNIASNAQSSYRAEDMISSSLTTSRIPIQVNSMQHNYSNVNSANYYQFNSYTHR